MLSASLNKTFLSLSLSPFICSKDDDEEEEEDVQGEDGEIKERRGSSQVPWLQNSQSGNAF